MSNEGPHGVAAALLGVEIGRNKVRLALLDPDGKSLDDAIERPIAKGGGPRDPMEEESSTRAAIEAGVERLGLTRGMPVMVGVTIGFPHCGVGSGPALRTWLAELSSELGEPIVYVGDHGVSYAPVHCIDFVRRVFEPTMLHLDRIELAPVSASRAIESLRSGAVTLGSGVGWSARILDRDVLEAFEVIDGAFDEVLRVVSNGVSTPIEHLDGVYVDDTISRSRGLNPSVLAPAVGVAVALHDNERSNLLSGQIVAGPGSRQVDPFHRVESRLTAPPVPRGERPIADARWGLEDAATPSTAGVEARARTGGATVSSPSDRDHVVEESTYRLNRMPPRSSPAPEHPMGDHGGRTWPAATPARAARDDMAGIESFSPQSSGLDAREGFHVSDFLLGALLMLALILLATLVLL